MADRVTVIGWDGSPLTRAAQAALDAATLVAGGNNQLRDLRLPPGAERMALGSVTLVARRIADHRGAAVVVAEGDPGFFGVVRTLRRPEYGLELEVLPAVSSVAAAFARAGMPWDDAQVVSTHGRGLRRAANVCRANPKVGVLTSPGAGPSELALMLRDVHRTFVICEALGTPDENITVLTSDRVPDHLWRDPNVVIVIGGGPHSPDAASGWLAGRPLDFPGIERGWAAEAGQPVAPADVRGAEAAPEELPEPRLELPAAVRSLVLARLGPRPGDLLWDVGAGSGSLAVDAARAGAAVLAVDQDADACARIDVSARRYGVEVRTVHGTAPAVLADLPEPDVVLVRGDASVLRACLGRRPERVVALPRTLEQVEAVRRVLAEVGYATDGALVQSTPLAPLVGAGGRAEREPHPLAPVFVLWGDR
ncbi:precorrin-6y C5,15-methyltransferase (decarboxylating) subunit CbiE [Streptacidiphilus sp. PB12-B1b]|uniref:precorrin-6y C5,15-methyltransferase (decarboxylating) subunit CbiE n=1 Tax=Streptacidiphilus sp. PB12-B1b TaxID=2705012 RepID=UPI0015FB56D4|nr:precorrin-6y C5,15-methyltransferase (decarboxylating) subunit CbiE [Streptacidiphilus sp. PB12-B1b]QMU76374.1 precorrin-6y C5,15-methyltransferase (decarboxylating) subunit CbiE [Streptacidiphilus sp. PB12-B1b]